MLDGLVSLDHLRTSFGRLSTRSPELRGAARERLLGGVATAAGGALLFAICQRLLAPVTITSDTASAVLQGKAIVSGNVLLHGWTLSRASFLATDLPFYALTAALRGASVDAARDAGAVIFSLLVLSACWLARGEARGREAVLRMAIPFLMLMAAASGTGVHKLLLGPFHVGTTLFLLLALIVVDRAAHRLPGLFILWVLLTLAVMSDMLAVFVGVVPLAFVAAARQVERRSVKWPDAGVLLGAVLALPASVLLMWLLSRQHSFSTLPLQGELVRIQDIPTNLALTAKGALLVFGVDFLVRRPTLASLPTLVCLVGLVLVAALWWRTIRSWRSDERPDLVTQALAVGMAADVAAYLFSNQPVDLWTSRYLIPLLVFGAVLAGRRAPGWLWRGRFRVLAVTIALAYAGVLVLSLRAPAEVNHAAALGAFLERQHLSYGLGGYWDASSVTVETGGRVRLGPIDINGGTATPYRWEAADTWYDPSVPENDARFVVRDPSWSRSSLETAFGPPSREYRVDGYDVLVWDRNLLYNMDSPYRPPSSARAVRALPRH